jgi:FecR protein
MHHLHRVTISAVIIAGVAGATSAQATVRVGGAMRVERDVAGSLSGQTWSKKARGDDVYENEFIRTAMESAAQIVFVDKTQISLGPTATMKIDRVVFNPNHSVRALTVNAEAGAMRWNSGGSGSNAYQINTPTASIRVEGTTFDLFVESQRTMVLLQDGKVEVCSVGATQRCKTLSERGEMIVASPGVLEGPRRGGPGPSDFASRCLSATSPSCVITIKEGATPPPQSPAKRETRKYQEPPAKPAPSKSATYQPASADPPSKPAQSSGPVVHPKVVVVTPPPTISPPPLRHLYVISKALTGSGGVSRPPYSSNTPNGGDYRQRPPTPKPLPNATPRPAPYPAGGGGVSPVKNMLGKMPGAVTAIRSTFRPRLN